MSLFEITAAALGILSVFFSTGQNVLAWPASLLNNAMYGVFFFRKRLYALMSLQVFFGGIALYGWYQWLHGGAGDAALEVSHIPFKLGLLLAALSIIGTFLIWYVLRRFTQDPSPFIDALFFAVSLTAQWMMARKYIECWPIWVGINCISVPFFFVKRAYPTMVQYAVFLVLAIIGWVQWGASLAK